MNTITVPQAGARKAAFLDHSFELAVAVLHIASAIALVTARFSLQLNRSTTMSPLSLILISSGFLIGGALILAGPYWRGSAVVGRAVERAGLYILIAAWIVLASLVVLLRGSESPGVLSQAAPIIVGCAGRVAALRRIDRAVESATAQAADFTED